MQHSFTDSVKVAEADQLAAILDKVYQVHYPDMIGSHRFVGDSDWQRQGVDRVIYLPALQEIYAEEKIRVKDFGDFLWELYSSDQTKSPGWTVDPTKASDVIVYVTPLYVRFIPYPALRGAVVDSLQEWIAASDKQVSVNPGYNTINYSVGWDFVEQRLGEIREYPFEVPLDIHGPDTEIHNGTRNEGLTQLGLLEALL